MEDTGCLERLSEFLRFLWFFTCVTEVFPPPRILLIVQTSTIRQSVFPFSSFFIYLFILEFRNLLLSVPSILSYVVFCSLSCWSFYFILFSLFPVLFSPSVYSLYFLILFIVLFSNLLSFLFYFTITIFCLPLPFVLLVFNLFYFCYSSSFESPLSNTLLPFWLLPLPSLYFIFW